MKRPACLYYVHEEFMPHSYVILKARPLTTNDQGQVTVSLDKLGRRLIHTDHLFATPEAAVANALQELTRQLGERLVSLTAALKTKDAP